VEGLDGGVMGGGEMEVGSKRGGEGRERGRADGDSSV